MAAVHSIVFSPADSFSLPDNAGAAVPWTGYLNIDIAAIAPGATKVELALDNSLTAATNNGGSAHIAKKDFSGLTITIPEPAAGALWVAGLILGLAARHRGN